MENARRRLLQDNSLRIGALPVLGMIGIALLSGSMSACEKSNATSSKKSTAVPVVIPPSLPKENSFDLISTKEFYSFTAFCRSCLVASGVNSVSAFRQGRVGQHGSEYPSVTLL